MFRKFLVGFASLAVTVLITQQSSASLLMIMNDTSTAGIDVVVMDDSLAGGISDTGAWVSNTADAGAGAGKIEYSGSVGSFVVNVTTGLSNPVIGDNSISMTSVNVSGGVPGSIELWLIDTDFADNGYTFNTQFGGFTQGTVSFVSVVDLLNSEGFDSGDYVGINGDVIQSGIPYASNDAFNFNEYSPNIATGVDPFAMAVGVYIQHDQALDVTSFGVHLSQVPEPGTLAVWSVLGLGFLCPYRRRKSA